MCGPAAVSVDSYGIVYAAELTVVVIRIVAVIALVASVVGINGNTLADLKDRRVRSELIDRTHEFVAEDQSPVLLAGEGSLKNILFLK